MSLEPESAVQNNAWFAYSTADLVVVFVHGVLSDSRTCWLRQEDVPAPVYWPKLLTEDNRFPEMGIFLGGYTTAIDSGPYEIRNCAHELYSALCMPDVNGHPPVMSKLNIIFVCHSTGGIVVRYMLYKERDSFKEKHVGVVLIASPSYGSRLADRLGLIADFYAHALGKQLRWGNWSLRELDDNFKNLVHRRLIPRLDGIEAYEHHFVVHSKLLPERLLVVDKESAGRYFDEPVLLSNTDHFTSVKPDSVRHPAHELVLGFILRHFTATGPEPTREYPSAADSDPFAAVPPLPGNFIDRADLTYPLLNTLLSVSTATRVTALQGMGGVGKSVIALSLCHDSRIRHAFADGIIWLTFGRKSGVSLAHAMEQIATIANHKFRTYNELAYRGLLRTKSMLLVLDDIWSLEDIEPFLLPSGRSRILYTSRNREIAGSIGAESHDISLLDHLQARHFLLKWSNREKSPPDESYTEKILLECQGLVLALAMIGSALRGQADSEWGFVGQELERGNEVGTRPSGYEHQTMHASIDFSVEALTPSARHHYLQLAVLRKGMVAPELLLRDLWGGSPDAVHRLARRFVDRSLAMRNRDGSLSVHDLQLDYLRAKYPEPSALEVIHSAILGDLHIIERYPEQFASLMIGRLLPYVKNPDIAEFIKRLDTTSARPRLRPLQPGQQGLFDVPWVTGERKTYMVMAVALSGNGNRAITGHHDGTVRVWEVNAVEPLAILSAHGSAINAVALSGDGSRAVAVSTDGTARVWELDGTDRPRLLEGHSDAIKTIALSADGSRAIASSHGDYFMLWDLNATSSPRILKGHTGLIGGLALSADGTRAVSCSSDATLRVWALDNAEPPIVLEVHNSSVHAVALSADGTRAISASSDNTMCIWDLTGAYGPNILAGHVGEVDAVALSADGSRAISCSNDYSLRVWDLSTYRCLLRFVCDARVVHCCCAAEIIAISDTKGRFHIFRIEEEHERREKGYKATLL